MQPEVRTTPEAPQGVIILSPAYHFLETTTPLRYSVRAVVRADTHPGNCSPARCWPSATGTTALLHWRHLTTVPYCSSTRSAGDLVVVADTLAPRARALFEPGADLSCAEALRFAASDNFSGIAAWSLTIDGKWVPRDRFPMKGTLVHFFDTPATWEQHTARLSVTDACGNTTHVERTFFR